MEEEEEFETTVMEKPKDRWGNRDYIIRIPSGVVRKLGISKGSRVRVRISVVRK